MRIKNETNRTFLFKGGRISAKEIVDIEDEKEAEALVNGYPEELIAIDNIVATVVKAEKPENGEVSYAELKERAKELGIAGYGSMKKEALKIAVENAVKE